MITLPSNLTEWLKHINYKIIMLNTFLRSEYQKEIEKNGYIVHTHNQFSITQKVNSLYNKYYSEHHQFPFTTSHFSFNKKYKEDLFELSQEIFEQNFSLLFNNYRLLFSNLMIKHPHTEGHLPMHADWSYVDEDKFRAISIWLPTIDTNEKNGILGVIPQSHLLAEEMRGPEIISTYRKFDSLIQKNNGIVLPITCHQALIYDLRLQHFSFPNYTEETRIAINIVIVPKEASIHHFIRKEDKIYRYDNLDADFYLDYNAHQIPERYQPSQIRPAEHNITDDAIAEFYHIKIKKDSSDFWKKFKNFFR